MAAFVDSHTSRQHRAAVLEVVINAQISRLLIFVHLDIVLSVKLYCEQGCKPLEDVLPHKISLNIIQSNPIREFEQSLCSYNYCRALTCDDYTCGLFCNRKVFIASFMKILRLTHQLLQGLKNFQIWRLIKHVISLKTKKNFATKFSHQEQMLIGCSTCKYVCYIF